MTGTPAVKDERQRKPQCTWFVVTAAASAICLAWILAWSASDASFRLASWANQVLLGTTKDSATEIAIVRPALKWDALGLRVATLRMLFGVGLACTGALAWMTARHATASRILGCAVLIAAWIGFVTTRGIVHRWCMTRQVSAELPRLRAAAAGLSRRWPDRSGEIPPGISVRVAPNYPDVLLVRGVEAYPMQESLGRMITRGRNGIIRFDLAAAYDSEVEYHPNGTEPAAYVSGLGYPSPPAAWVHRFSDEWFLVQYAVTDGD